MNYKLVQPIYTYIKGKSPRTIQGCVELLKKAYTAQLAQQTDTAVNLQYLVVNAGKANNQFKLLNTKITKRLRLEQITQHM